MTVKQRRNIIKGVIAVVWVGLGVLLFVLNRGHSLLLDNKNVEALNLRAPDMITVTLNGGKPAEFFRNDRDIFEVTGNVDIVIEFSDGTPKFEKTVKLPLKDDVYLLSIPKMLAGVEPFFEPFDLYGAQPQTDDEETGADEEAPAPVLPPA